MKYELIKIIVAASVTAAELMLAAALPELNGIQDRFYTQRHK